MDTNHPRLKKPLGSYLEATVFGIVIDWVTQTKDSREMYSFQSQDNQICLMHYIILYALLLIPNAGWCHLGALYPHPRHRRHPPRRLHHHGQVSFYKHVVI